MDADEQVKLGLQQVCLSKYHLQIQDLFLPEWNCLRYYFPYYHLIQQEQDLIFLHLKLYSLLYLTHKTNLQLNNLLLLHL